MQTNKHTIEFDKKSLTILFTSRVNQISKITTTTKQSTTNQHGWFMSNIDSVARELENLTSIVCDSLVEYKPTSIIYRIIFGTENDINLLADNIERYYIGKLIEKYLEDFYPELSNSKSNEIYAEIKTIILRLSR